MYKLAHILPRVCLLLAFGIITFILGVVMLVCMCVNGCCFFPDNDYALTHRWEAPMYLLITICQGLVLLLLASNACDSKVLTGLGTPQLRNVTFEETCQMATGAKLVVSATVFWFCAAVTSFLANKAERAEMAGEDEVAKSDQVAVATEEGESKPEEVKPIDDAVPEQAVVESGGD